MIEAAVGGTETNRTEQEQRPEGQSPIEAPVETEHVLVEIGLQVLLADAVEGSVEPGLEIGGDGTSQGQPSIHAGAVAPHRERLMQVTVVPSCVAAETRVVFQEGRKPDQITMQ